jgi:hypothetical protein
MEVVINRVELLNSSFSFLLDVRAPVDQSPGSTFAFWELNRVRILRLSRPFVAHGLLSEHNAPRRPPVEPLVPLPQELIA